MDNLPTPGFFIGLLIGIISSILFAGFNWFKEIVVYWWNYKRHLNNKIFKSYYKSDTKKQVRHQFILKVKKNVISFYGTRCADGSEIIGKIKMDETLENYGRGYHYHKHSGREGFAFSEYQLTPDKKKIYVESTYIWSTEDKRKTVPQAFIWESVENDSDS